MVFFIEVVLMLFLIIIVVNGVFFRIDWLMM